MFPYYFHLVEKNNNKWRGTEWRGRGRKEKEKKEKEKTIAADFQREFIVCTDKKETEWMKEGD